MYINRESHPGDGILLCTLLNQPQYSKNDYPCYNAIKLKASCFPDVAIHAAKIVIILSS